MPSKSDEKKYAESHPDEFKTFLAMEATRFFTRTLKPITIILLFCMAWNTSMGGTVSGLAWVLPTLYMQLGSYLAAILSQRGSWSDLRRYLPDGLLFFVLMAIFVLNLNFSLEHKFSENAPTLVATLVCSVVSYHRLRGTAIRNALFFALFALACLHWLSADPHLKAYITQAFLGTLTGTCLSRLYTVAIEFRFMNSHTGQKIQRHLIGELEKLAFPHQIEAIQSGDALESTMPVAVSKATVLVFDVQGSSRIASAAFKKVLDQVLSSCNDYLATTYTKNRECLAYKLNEAYDGFICSVGFPFQVPRDVQHWDHDHVAVDLAFKFLGIFDEITRREFPHEKVFCSVGIAKGEIEGYYPQSGPRVYGMRGSSIILAARYEAYRKALLLDEPLNANIIQLHAAVWAGLPYDLRQKFLRSDLPTYSPIRNADGETEIYYFLSDRAEQVKIERAYRTVMDRIKARDSGLSEPAPERLRLIDKKAAR